YHRHVHSFPTRRSSDLTPGTSATSAAAPAAAVAAAPLRKPRRFTGALLDFAICHSFGSGQMRREMLTCRTLLITVSVHRDAGSARLTTALVEPCRSC